MEDKEVIETLTKHEEQLKALDKRVEACEETTRAINSLTQSIVKMDVTLNNTNEVVKDLRADVNELKDEPKKRWNAIITAIISTIVGGVVGAAIAVFL